MNVLSRVRPELLRFAGYSSARREASGGSIWLNANESPWSALGAAGLNRYPEPQPAALCVRLSALYGVAPAQLLVSRGSDEAIDLLVRLFCRAGRDSIVIAPPTFGYYRVCASLQGARAIEVSLKGVDEFALDADAVLAAVEPETKLVFLCSPNNPTGGVVPRAQLLRIAAALAGRALVVVDEAYIEFADEASVADAVARYENLAVLRTLSKAHGLAGARIGCLIAAPELIGLLRRVMAPYALAQPAVDAALRATEADALEATLKRVAILRDARERLRARLGALPCVRAILSSQANFLCVRFDDAAAVYRQLYARGVVVRDVSHYPGLEQCLRVSIGTPEENAALIEALAVHQIADAGAVA
jgi:histidinol-phosphate aminotransferase